MLGDNLAALVGRILYGLVLPGRSFRLDLAQILLVIPNHVLDVRLIVRRSREPLKLGYGLTIILRDLVRRRHSNLLGHRLHLLVQLGMVIEHALGELLYLVVTALLQRQLG